MVTEQNTIKTEISDFESVRKTLWQKYFICSVVLLVIGVAGVLAYIILSTVWETLYEYSPAWFDALLIFAVPLGVGLVFTLSFRSTFKQVKKLSGIKDEYEFYSDCFIVREQQDGEEKAVIRIEYNKIVKTKEKGKFIFTRQLGGGSAFPIDITALSQVELNTVKKLLKLPVPQDAEILELASSADCDAQIAVSEIHTQNEGEIQ